MGPTWRASEACAAQPRSNRCSRTISASPGPLTAASRRHWGRHEKRFLRAQLHSLSGVSRASSPSQRAAGARNSSHSPHNAAPPSHPRTPSSPPPSARPGVSARATLRVCLRPQYLVRVSEGVDRKPVERGARRAAHCAAGPLLSLVPSQRHEARLAECGSDITRLYGCDSTSIASAAPASPVMSFANSYSAAAW